MDLGLEGKTAVVTGGSRGIGKATTLALAREGCDVAICARNKGPLDESAAEIAAATGRKILPVVCDTLDSQAVSHFIDTAARELGSVEILVNNAAFTGGPPGTFETAEEEQTLRDFDEKVLGYMRCGREAARYMREAGWGRIVNVSGVAGRVPSPLISAGLRNIAVVSLTKSMALELAADGVTANVVYPGGTVTERDMEIYAAHAQRLGVTVEAILERVAEEFPSRHVIFAEEVARVITFLCSPVSVPITGEAISVSGIASPEVHL